MKHFDVMQYCDAIPSFLTFIVSDTFSFHLFETEKRN